MLIAEDEKIICEVTKDNETIIEERLVALLLLMHSYSFIGWLFVFLKITV